MVGSAWVSDDCRGQEEETPPWTHLGAWTPVKAFLSNGGSMIVKLRSRKPAVGSAWLFDDRGGQDQAKSPDSTIICSS